MYIIIPDIMIRYISGKSYKHSIFRIVDPVREMELATIFFARETAIEICKRVNSREQFFRTIPEVPAFTEYPRPKDIVVTSRPDEMEGVS